MIVCSFAAGSDIFRVRQSGRNVCINGEIPIDVSLFLSYAMPFVLVLILLGVTSGTVEVMEMKRQF